MNKKYIHNGFTIVETTMAIAFVSILMIAIVILAMKAGSMSVKGDTNKAVNQTGRDISDSIRRDFLGAGMNDITMINEATSVSGGGEYDRSGRVCVGEVAYVWNLAGLLNRHDKDNGTSGVVMLGRGAAASPAHFVRIPNGKTYCSKMGSGVYATSIAETTAVDLLKGSGRDYALYRFSATPFARDGASGVRGMYHIKFTIGTYDSDAITKDVTNTYEQCKPNVEEKANFDYCAVNDFDMIVRVGGGMSS